MGRIMGTRIGLVLLVCALLGPAATADVLVTTEGAHIETRGPWEVKGRQVIFTTASGTLSSMRLDEVDLEASEAETERIASAAEAADEEVGTDPAPAARETHPAAREPVLVLTDADVPRAAAPTASPAPAAEAAEDAPVAEEAVEVDPNAVVLSADQLEVSRWQPRTSPDFDGVEILGAVVNRGERPVLSAKLVVVVQADGQTIRADAVLSNDVIGPGRQTGFRALVRGVAEVIDPPRFELSGKAYRPKLTAQSEETEAAEAGAAEAGDETGSSGG